MGNKIIIILFCVFVLGVVVYVISSNVLGKFTAPFGAIIHYKASDWFTTPSSTLTAGNSGTAPKTQSSAVSGYAGGSIAISTSEIPFGFTLAELSPYFQEVRISSAWPANYSAYGEIILSSYSLGASATIDITGWQIKTNRSGEYVPQAIDLYDPSGLSAPTDILLGRGQYVYLYSSSGPFNLRLNKCIGYIGNTNKTTPALPQNCPYIDQSAISKLGFTGACETYIYSLGSCQVPDMNSMRIPSNDYACRDYLVNNFNYKACFLAHVGDADFLSNQWWVWMGGSPLDPYHDIVNLFDRNGLLVDQYSY